jgi:7,8-dihydropterin-6-yl-methyl-4-(beta-D-ribofuranosyl)aminobenzene 5'-phosphate synthase
MKLKILSENTAMEGYEEEHGLSYFIDHNHSVLLFDTGASDVFLRNALKLNVDLSRVENIILSHGHFDHGNGLEYLKAKTLICHPECFIKRYTKQDHRYIGLSMSEDEIREKYNLITSQIPYKISDDITYLGEIPRLNDFEAKTSDFIKEDGSDDFVADDSALAIQSDDGLIVVTGCSHSGICNIIDYAKKVTMINKVHAVIGGFHLKILNTQSLQTIGYLKKEEVRKVFPSHCTYEPVLSAIIGEFDSFMIGAGMEMVL